MGGFENQVVLKTGRFSMVFVWGFSLQDWGVFKTPCNTCMGFWKPPTKAVYGVLKTPHDLYGVLETPHTHRMGECMEKGEGEQVRHRREGCVGRARAVHPRQPPSVVRVRAAGRRGVGALRLLQASCRILMTPRVVGILCLGV